MVQKAKVPKGKKPRVLIPVGPVTHDKTALVTTNPRVMNIAFRLRWTTETVVRRVEAALASPIERQMYLQVAGGYRIQPESLAKLLIVFRGTAELQESDLVQHSVGPNMVLSRFDQIVLKIETALALLDKTDDGADYMMSMMNTAQLVEAYDDYAVEVVGMIVENVAGVAELLRLRTNDPRKIVGVAIKTLIQEVLPKQQAKLPMTIEEMFRDNGLRGLLP